MASSSFISNRRVQDILTSIGSHESDFVKALDTGSLAAVQAELVEKINDFKKISVRIGLIGQTGAGKSTFNNAVRNLKGGDPGAAEIGLTNTTVRPMGYPHPNNESLVFWDLPGVDSPNFPKETYLEQIDFQNYDFFVVLTKDRFKDCDLWLVREIKELGTNFFFARTNIDCSIQSQKKGSRNPKSDEEYLEQMKKDIKDNLGDLDQEDSVFLIDSLEPRLYDFDRLQARLVQELPKLKRDALALSLTATGEKMIELKANAIRGTIKQVAVANGLLAIIPYPGYPFLFPIDATTMTKWMTDQLQVELENKAAEAVLISATEECGVVLGTLKAVEEGVLRIPIIGSCVSAPLSVYNTNVILNEVLNKLVEKAKIEIQQATQETNSNSSQTKTKIQLPWVQKNILVQLSLHK